MIRDPRLRGPAAEIIASDSGLREGQPRSNVGVPDPVADVESLYNTVVALKEQVEILTRQRGYADDGALFIRDLSAIRNLILRAPDNEAQYGLINGVWVQLGRFKPLVVEPTNPVVGLVVYADGTSWNPGRGEGLYLYKSDGQWYSLHEQP